MVKSFGRRILRLPFALDVECGVHEVHVLLVQLLTQQLHCFAKTLEVDHFTLPKEFDDVIHVRIVGKTQNVIVGNPCFLFCCELIR